MEYHLKELGYDFLTNSIPLPKALEIRVNEKFNYLHDFFILGKAPDNILEYKIKHNDIANKIGLETSFNTTYITEYFNYEKSQAMKSNDFLGLGLEFLKRLAERLKKKFPDEKFCLIMEFSNIQEDIEYPSFEACEALFYKVREKEYDYFKTTSEWYLNKGYTIGMLEIRI